MSTNARFDIRPSKIQLEACSACQLKCASCYRTTEGFRSGAGIGFLKFSDFKRLVDDNPWIKEIELSNNGEIFLNPELLQIIKYAHELGIALTADNGVNLNTVEEDVLEGLVKYRFKRMTVSIDGASSATYRRYRLGGDFDTVIGNIKKINRFKQRYQSEYPRLAWQFIVFGHNEHEMEIAAKMATELGMSFSPKLTWDDEFSPLRNPARIRELVGAATREEYRLKHGVDYAQRTCQQLWDDPQINWDGRVLGCYRDFWSDFGANAFEDGLMQSINSEKMQYARDMLLGEKEPMEGIPCTECSIYMHMKAEGKWLERPASSPARFPQEYDLTQVRPIAPKDRHFQMLVAPRYVTHHVAHSHEKVSSEVTALESQRKIHCLFCGQDSEEFLPLGLDIPVLKQKNVVGGGYRLNAMCPHCRSTDRDRLVYLYLKNKRPELVSDGQNLRLLHVAPERNLQKVLSVQPNIDYISADLDSPLAMVQMDIRQIRCQDDLFDVIICNHVLEHVSDDRKAMAELYRVLKPGGWAILQVPISLSLNQTCEDPLVTSPEERERVFGQSDHVRIYATDYKNRLEEVGFSVEVYSPAEEFGQSTIRRHGLLEDENVYTCFKPASSGEGKRQHPTEGLKLIAPAKRGFLMLVTPGRYADCYGSNLFEDFTSDLLLAYSRDEMMFIDIGAHYGYYTLLVGTRYPGCRIMAVEPVPENYDILRQNIKLNQLESVNLHNVAITDSNRTREFNIAEASGSSGFIEHPLTRTAKVVRLDAVSLDSLVGDLPEVPIIVKIDTEGHEPCVLQGMKKLLSDREDIKLIVEFNPKCLRKAGYEPGQFLREIIQLGFDIYAVDDDGRMACKLDDHGPDNWVSYLPGQDENRVANLLCIRKQKSLSVCFFSHSAQLAGAERSLLELVTELVRNHGVVCSVILPGDGPLRQRLEEVGASTLIVSYSWSWASNPPPEDRVNELCTGSARNLLHSLKHVLSRINPDIIVTNTIVIPWGAIAASFLGKPHAWFVREFGEADQNLKPFLPVDVTLDFVSSLSDLVITNSDAVRRALFPDMSSDRVVTIHPYVSIPGSALSQDERSQFIRTESTKLVISATVNRGKGQQDAVLAVKELVRGGRDVELVIMGGCATEYAECLKTIVREEKLEEQVRLIGFRENPYPIMNQADVVVVSSRNEAFGRSTVEGMLLKKPVIGTNSGGTVELVEDGVNGLLYEPGDHIELAAKIERLMDHPDEAARLAQKGYEFATETFTASRFGGEVHRLLQSLKRKAALQPSPSDLTPEGPAMLDGLLSAAATRNPKVGALITELGSSLASKESEADRLESSLKEKTARVTNLEARAANLQAQVSKLETQLAGLKKRVKTLEGRLSAVYASYSWRITRPLRAAADAFRLGWFMRNTRRAFILLGWLATGQFSRAGNALLPYYQRYVPLRVQLMIPNAVQRAAQRWLMTGQKKPETIPDVKSLQRLTGTRVLVFSHNLDGAEGAPTSLYEMCIGLKEHGISPIVISPSDGSLRTQYEKHGIPVVVALAIGSPLQRLYRDTKYHNTLRADLHSFIGKTAIELVIANTTLGFHIVQIAGSCRVPSIWIIRESEDPLGHFAESLPADIRPIFLEALANVDQMVFVSENTRDAWERSVQLDPNKVSVIPNRLNLARFAKAREKDRRKLRARLGLRDSDVVLLNVGTICQRKNQMQLLDSLLLLPLECLQHVRLICVGRVTRGAYSREFLERIGADDRLRIRAIHVPPTPDIGDYYRAADVFVLSSLFESYPRVTLEAMEFSLPLIVSPVYGVLEQTEEGVNALYYDAASTETLADRIMEIIDPDTRHRLSDGSRRKAALLGDYTSMVKSYTELVRSLVETTPATVDVSVIVPNYDYERYLPERLGSIINQTVRPREIIFLDDASTDNSVGVARHILEQSPIPFKIVSNQTNAGTYRQWLNGIAEAEGEFVWIAEADDTCEPGMLAALVAAMQDERVAIAYCQSKRIDENGVVTAPDNLGHTNELDPDRWRNDYRELGVREVVDWLFYRNTIPNTSACLLRKSAIAGIEDRLSQARFCGDRLLYAHMLRQGDIAYVARPLNRFRRHSGTVTAKRRKTTALLEEVISVRKHICEDFPVHPCQLPRMVHFLDKEYKVEGVNKNSEHPAVMSVLETIEALVRQNRRFAFITTNTGSFDGGSELWWRESAKRLRALGHDVIVLIKKWDPPPPYLDDFAGLGIKSCFKEDQGFESIVGFKPDLVVISVGDQDEGIEYYGQLHTNSIPYIIVNRLTKEPRFWPIRNDRNERVRDGYLSARKVFFASVNNRRVMEERLGCTLPHWGIIYSPNHADRNAVLPFPPVSDGASLAVPASIRFVHKGQDLIVDVMKQDRWRKRNVTINIYGVGSDEERLKDMVKKARLEDHVLLHGKLVFVGREHEISQIWLHNHAILLPSRMEGFANTVIHAMMSGRVPIVTDIGGHGDVIEDGVTGFIASDPTPEALDEAMERAYQRRHEWEEIGRRARQAILNYLPEDPVADAVDKLLQVVGLEPVHAAVDTPGQE